MSINNNRNYGLDVLRILSMLGIVGLHVLNHGGIIENARVGSWVYYLAWILEIIFYCSVNIFSMLTGYLYVDKNEIKKKSIVNLWMITLFYSLLMLSIFRVFKPSVFVNKKMYINALFPFITDGYWYIVCYTFMFFMIPFLNIFLCKIEKDKYKKLIFTLIVFLSIISTFGLKDYFQVINGYSPFWLIVCYIIGAYIKKYGSTIKNRKNLYITVFLINISVLLFSREAIRYFTTRFLGHMTRDMMLIQYNSPLILVNAIMLFLIFKEINVNNNMIRRIIVSFSNAAFGVYIIHCNTLVFDNIIVDGLDFLMKYRWGIFGGIIAIICIYGVCWIMEHLRSIIFRRIKINELSKAIGERIDKYFI